MEKFSSKRKMFAICTIKLTIYRRFLTRFRRFHFYRLKANIISTGQIVFKSEKNKSQLDKFLKYKRNLENIKFKDYLLRSGNM